MRVSWVRKALAVRYGLYISEVKSLVKSFPERKQHAIQHGIHDRIDKQRYFGPCGLPHLLKILNGPNKLQLSHSYRSARIGSTRGWPCRPRSNRPGNGPPC